MFNNNWLEDWNVRIQYIYYGVLGENGFTENAVHQIPYDKIVECLIQHNFVLRKEEIAYLLKDDGADFIVKDLRIYEPDKDNFFLVHDDWQIEVDENDPEFSLLFWIKSANSDLERKIENMSSELKITRNLFENNFSYFQDTNKLVFSQLADIHRRLSQLGPDDLVIDPVSTPAIERPMFRMALMYSEPLVKKDSFGIISLGDPVDYEEECNNLLDLLKARKKRIEVYFEIATIENLVNVLSSFPKVLHIICHGEFSKENNQFYLCFEEEGKLKELYASDLREILAEIELETDIVFVNACHSEEVARVFQKAGVPCVIAVQSELKIEDHVAQMFSEAFYRYFFEGKSVRKAFDLAKVAVHGRDVYTCCCAHSHKQDCEWYKLAKEDGFEKAHRLHTPTCTNCRHKNKFLHNLNCSWAQDFLMMKCGKEELDEVYEGVVHACCCSQEYEHNEALKFFLFCSNEEIEKQALFLDREEGEVSIKSYHSCVNKKFPVMRLTGRNKELYGMYEALTDKEKKIINLYGIEGIGKSSLAKQMANYLFERRLFKDKIAIISLDRTPSTVHFRNDLFKEAPGAYNLMSFCDLIKNDKALFILDKCDRLLQQEEDEFKTELAKITENATNVKFIIITNERANLELVGDAYVCMRELKKLDAAKIVCKNAYTFLNWQERNVDQLKEHGVFDYIPLTPQGIWSVVEKLRHGRKSLKEIEYEMFFEKKEQEDGSSRNQDDEATKMTLA